MSIIILLLWDIPNILTARRSQIILLFFCFLKNLKHHLFWYRISLLLFSDTSNICYTNFKTLPLPAPFANVYSVCESFEKTKTKLSCKCNQSYIYTLRNFAHAIYRDFFRRTEKKILEKKKKKKKKKKYIYIYIYIYSFNIFA